MSVALKTFLQSCRKVRAGGLLAILLEELANSLDEPPEALDAMPSGVRRAAEKVLGGQSGIEIDYFANELITTGYLHNHARMWFAAIWFTSSRRQRSGLSHQHLLDGDPAQTRSRGDGSRGATRQGKLPRSFVELKTVYRP